MESHFVMGALFKREVLITQSDDIAEFGESQSSDDGKLLNRPGDLTGHANGSPMIHLRSPGDASLPCTAVMRKTEEKGDDDKTYTKVWFGGPDYAPEEPSLVLDSTRSYPELTLVHFKNLDELFTGGDWYAS